MYTPIPDFDKTMLNYCEEYIHRAAQFLAMVGKNYLEDQPDDSNANLAFLPKQSSIVSREVGNGKKFQLALDVAGWRLQIVEGKKETSDLKLTGKKKDDVFEWLRDEIVARGLNAENLKYIDHYEVPDHAVDHGQGFPEMIGMTVEKWLIMRSNAEVLLADLNKIVGKKSEIRIWPHHFDTGTYYELEDQKAIGAGWAIADTLCDNPYLYIYAWNGNAELDYSDCPELEVGRWIVQDNWKGAVLEAEPLSQSENQYEIASDFMKKAIDFLKPQLS